MPALADYSQWTLKSYAYSHLDDGYQLRWRLGTDLGKDLLVFLPVTAIPSNDQCIAMGEQALRYAIAQHQAQKLPR